MRSLGQRKREGKRRYTCCVSLFADGRCPPPSRFENIDSTCTTARDLHLIIPPNTKNRRTYLEIQFIRATRYRGPWIQGSFTSDVFALITLISPCKRATVQQPPFSRSRRSREESLIPVEFRTTWHRDSAGEGKRRRPAFSSPKLFQDWRTRCGTSKYIGFDVIELFFLSIFLCECVYSALGMYAHFFQQVWKSEHRIAVANPWGFRYNCPSQKYTKYIIFYILYTLYN